MSQRETAVHVRPTRLGWQFAFIGIFAMLGGAIRSYNLPLLLAGLLVGGLVLQWRWARLTLLAVTFQRRLPTEVFAGQPFTVRFLVNNHSHWLPAWLLRIDDSIHPLDEFAKRGGFGWWAVKRRTASGGAIKATCGLGVVPVARTMTARYDCVITRRGLYDFGPVKLSTGVPLGLMIAARRARERETLCVFPRRLTLKRHWRSVLQSRVGGSATTARRSGIQEGEFFGIRGWQAGDSRRWIHWRTTARIGEPAVRQYEQQRRFDLCILVDAYRPLSSVPDRNAPLAFDRAAQDETLEYVISTAATLVTALVATPNNKIGLALAGEQTTALTSGGGREQTIAMLRRLAGLVGSPTPDLSGAIKQMIRTAGRPRDLLIISPRTVVEDSQDLFQIIGSRSVWRWCGVADGSIDQLVERSLGEAVAVE